MLARSFLIESSSELLVTRTGIKAWTFLISGLWFPWPIYMFFEIIFDLCTLDSGERSLPPGLIVCHACFRLSQCWKCQCFCSTCFSMGDLGVQVSVRSSVRPSVHPSTFTLGVLWVELLLQFCTNLLETLEVFSSWYEDVYVVWI